MTAHSDTAERRLVIPIALESSFVGLLSRSAPHLLRLGECGTTTT